MQINLRRPEANRHPKPMFVDVSHYVATSFVVQVRQLRLPQRGLAVAHRKSMAKLNQNIDQLL